MGALAAGQIVLLLYPFSDLSRSKQRPGVLIATPGTEDWIVCQITSNPVADQQSLQLTDDDFKTGGLDHISYIRPNKVFTAHNSLIITPLGELKPEIFNNVRNALIQLIRAT